MHFSPRVLRRCLYAILASAATFAPMCTSAEEKPAEPASAATDEVAAPDFRHISANATSAIIVRPQLFFSSPGRETLPTEVLQALSIGRWGFDITKLKQAVFLVNGNETGKASPACILRFSDAISDKTKLAKTVLGLMPPINGQRMAFIVPKDDPDCVLYMAADEMPAMREANGDSSTPLLDELRHHDPASVLSGVVEMDSIKALLPSPFVSELPDAPSEYQAYADAVRSLTRASIQLNLSQGIDAQLEFTCRDERAAATLERMLRASFDGLGAFFEHQAAEIPEDGDAGSKQAANRYFRRMLGLVERRMEIRCRGSRLAVHLKDDSAQAVSGVLVGVLLPLRDSVQERSARLETMLRFHEIGLGVHNFHAVHHRMPTSSYDEVGRPLLSWRVFVLPFLGQQDLFDRFHLDEPWNSEHNLALLEQMPDVYRDPKHDAPFRTTYLRPVGKGALFVKGKDDHGRSLPEVAAWLSKDQEPQGWTRKLAIEDISDGTASTILLVEAAPERSVLWTKPDDLEFDAQKPLAGLGRAKDLGFLALFVDGHTRILPRDIDQEKLRLLFDPNDGQRVDPDK